VVSFDSVVGVLGDLPVLIDGPVRFFDKNISMSRPRSPPTGPWPWALITEAKEGRCGPQVSHALVRVVTELLPDALHDS
jgi:hypothetical protein